MQPKILEPLHPPCEKGCMAARIRAERNVVTLRTALRVVTSLALEPPYIAAGRSRGGLWRVDAALNTTRGIAEAAIAATKGDA